MATSLGSFHRKGGADVPVLDGGTGQSSASAGLAALGHGTQNHTGILGVGKIVQQVRAIRKTFLSLATLIPHDNSVPQSGEGVQVLSVAITPASLSNILLIEFSGFGNAPANGAATCALFRDSIAASIAASTSVSANGGVLWVVRHYLSVPTLAAQTYKIRCGANNGTAELNSIGGGTPAFGGVASTILTVTELTP